MVDVDLFVPRSRGGEFPTKLFEHYARYCRSVNRKLLTCFCLGLSAGKAATVFAPVLGEKFQLRIFPAWRGLWINRLGAITAACWKMSTLSICDVKEERSGEGPGSYRATALPDDQRKKNGFLKPPE